MENRKIPKPTIKRLAVYYRCLENLIKSGMETVSSQELGNRLNVKASQVRKDLSYFGEFGKRGIGYQTRRLQDGIAEILGIKREWNVCIVGAGNLGVALANYPGLFKSGYKIKAIFDIDPKKVGRKLQNGLVVEDLKNFGEIVRREKIHMGVIAVPASSAQYVANLMVSSRIEGIINFAPVRLNIPETFPLEEIDISLTFRALSFQINMQKNR
ncbi:redox-sensing transcriptional repressor rex [Kosmotoga arenicorallina S304]|uniref:Redox-sensing transcriptional repressor Rex n=1 Tax=Kosmotoga arenicorallina S304 TaxID=1453497 RepID=A0A182C731_9BACT|nr:redox-sensing transcriptional repressor Rex [Kosmotoga arenicorallina]OAA31240.1 redox-sensing transcriptional repressor rex [Kosmotoga arenicorallina S304]